jgi:hypothetical protein
MKSIKRIISAAWKKVIEFCDITVDFWNKDKEEDHGY